MIGLLYRLIVGRFSCCAHKWTTFTEMTTHPKGRPDVLAGCIYGLRCEKCGEIERRYVGLH